MFEVIVSLEAEIYIEESGKWYDKRLAGLSLRFFDEINEYILKIQNNPLSFSARKKGSDVRRCSLKKFPFNIFYLVEKNKITLLAVLHKSQSTRFIKKRLK